MLVPVLQSLSSPPVCQYESGAGVLLPQRPCMKKPSVLRILTHGQQTKHHKFTIPAETMRIFIDHSDVYTMRHCGDHAGQATNLDGPCSRLAPSITPRRQSRKPLITLWPATKGPLLPSITCDPFHHCWPIAHDRSIRESRYTAVNNVSCLAFTKVDFAIV